MGVRRCDARNSRRIWAAVVEDASGNRWKDFEIGDRSESTFMRLLERLPDEDRYETEGYSVYEWLPHNKHVVGKGGAVNWNETKDCIQCRAAG